MHYSRLTSVLQIRVLGIAYQRKEAMAMPYTPAGNASIYGNRGKMCQQPDRKQIWVSGRH